MAEDVAPPVLHGRAFELEWLETLPSIRERIEQTVARGDALGDVREAALAIGYVSARRPRSSIYWPVVVIGSIAMFVGVFVQHAIALSSGAASILLGAQGIARFRRTTRAFAAADTANRAVLAAYIAAHRPAPPREGSIAGALEEWRRESWDQ